MNLAVYLGQTLTLNLTLALDPNSNPNPKLMHNNKLYPNPNLSHNNKLYPNPNLSLTPALALTHDGLVLEPPFSDAACRRP